jgi:prepilin-type N-terminal cleavage/methylation domain-containing protein
LSRF